MQMNEQAKRRDDATEGRPPESETAVGEQAGSPADSGADVVVEESATQSADDMTDLEKAESKAAENWDRYLRTAAELENVRKRASRDVENAHRYALERFGRELLAVRDSLEMGLAADNASVESLREGSEATLKLLGNTMQQFGIEEVDPAGEPFDPELHEAISVQPSDDAEPGSVIAVVQKGYTLNGRLLRPAMVVVSAD